MDSSSMLEYNIDKTQVPAIDQKRIVAFINHFVVNTVTFLNEFAVNCETKFVDFESKLMQMESSLSILESKLESIPDLDRTHTATQPEAAVVSNPPESDQQITSEQEVQGSDVVDDQSVDDTINNNTSGVEKEAGGIRACDDERYRKYFKMVQFGVPAQAVKLKMVADGLDATDVLDDPNRILGDGYAQ